MFRKTNMWRGISMTSALFLTVSLLAGNILETYRTSVDAFVGTRSQVTVTDDAEDSWTYQSEFTSAKEAYEGFQELAIRTSQETFALLKNENASLPLKVMQRSQCSVSAAMHRYTVIQVEVWQMENLQYRYLMHSKKEAFRSIHQ